MLLALNAVWPSLRPMQPYSFAINGFQRTACVLHGRK